MTCDRRFLSFYRDGDLTLDQKHRVDEHLRECAECTATLHGYMRLAQTIRSLPEAPVPLSVVANVRSRVGEREVERRRGGLVGGLVRAAAPAFATAAIAVTIIVVLRPGVGGPPVPAPTAAPPPAPTTVAEKPRPTPAPVTAAPSSPRVQNPVVVAAPAPSTDRQRLIGEPAIFRLYQGSPALQNQLGAPAEGSKTVTLMEQSFQGGLGLWRGDSHDVYVLHRAGRSWTVYPNAVKPVDPAPANLTPPPGAMLPGAGFRSLWRASPDIQSRLGWAVYEPRGSGGVIQMFERGMIVWSPHGLLYVLTNDGKWKTYPDTPL